MTTAQAMSERELQKAVEEFIGQEVLSNITGLVDELNKADVLLDDYPHMYEGRASWGEWTCPNCKHTWDDEPEAIICPKCKENPLHRGDASVLFEATEHHPIFEYWIVSLWLANQLEDRGQSVEHDFYGLRVWGRGSTGQSMVLDRIIREIYEFSHINKE